VALRVFTWCTLHDGIDSRFVVTATTRTNARRAGTLHREWPVEETTEPHDVEAATAKPGEVLWQPTAVSADQRGIFVRVGVPFPRPTPKRFRC